MIKQILLLIKLVFYKYVILNLLWMLGYCIKNIKINKL